MVCVTQGDGEDYLALTLRDGAVTLNINLGSGKLDVQIRPPRVRFDDNQWHRVNIHRKAQEVYTLLVCRAVLLLCTDAKPHTHEEAYKTRLKTFF